MSRKVLITGGSGLVGKGIQHVLTTDEVSQYHQNDEFIFLSSKDGDLRSLPVCEELFEKHQPTHVIHLAAFVGGLFINMAKPVDFYSVCF